MAELQQRELLVASGGRGGATHRRHRCVLLLNSCWTETFTAQLHATARRSSRVYVHTSGTSGAGKQVLILKLYNNLDTSRGGALESSILANRANEELQLPV